jgi:cytochrome c biogenesis protein CcmG/thiol:disulfide interchange protein DsbE
MPKRPILLALLVAAVATLGFVWVVRTGQEGGGQRAAVGQPAPTVSGTTLDGSTFDLASYAGKPVVINFWGPSCVPCRDEFPLLESKVAEHAADGLAVVGVLTDDPVDPARSFVNEYGGTWPTVVDPDKSIKTAYRVAARPQTYFVDGAGIIRAIQVGGLTDADFERSFAKIRS